MQRYAKNTKVPISRSKAQIEETLLRYGIVEYGTGVSPRGEGLFFKHEGRMYKINVPNPNRKDFSTSDDNSKHYEKEKHHCNNNDRNRSGINNHSLSYSLCISS